MTNYVKVSDIIPNKNVSLIVNRTTSEAHFDIIKFQPLANLSYMRERGIFCDEPDYTNKVIKFFDLIIDKQPALVLTPEGSIPFKVIDEIICNKQKWPQVGRLWCLCMSGISTSDFIKFEDYLVTKENMFVHIEDNVNYRAHVNSLFYLFRLDQDTLAIVIQIKNNHMSDREFGHEADDLSKGNDIYIFDLNGGIDTKNILLTLICADAIQLPMSELITMIKYKYPLIVNAQCNSKPFDSRFVVNRNFIMSDKNVSKQRLIVVNWAQGTNLGKSFTVNDSGNTYYNYLGVSGHSHLKNLCSDQEVFIHRMKNQIKGFTYYANDNFNIWRFVDDENISRFYIKKDEVFALDRTLSSNFDPVIIEMYKYQDDNWLHRNKNCAFCDGKALEFYISNNQLLRPIYFEECKNNNRCSDECFWLYNDYFLGVCLGGELINELKCIGEISNRTLIAMNNESVDNTIKKREMFSILVKLLEANKIPDELIFFSKNLKFDIDQNAAECGSNNIYNVTIEKVSEEFPNWPLKKGIIAVVDTTQIESVEKVYEALHHATNIENRDQILLYFRQNGEYVPYKKPHELKSITPSNNRFTRNTTSIFKGGSQYEQDK